MRLRVGGLKAVEASEALCVVVELDVAGSVGVAVPVAPPCSPVLMAAPLPSR